MTIIEGVAYFMLVLAPLSIGGTVYLWILHRRTLTPLSRFLAWLGTAACLCAVVLAVASLFYVTGHIDLTQRLGPVVFLIFAFLDALPVILAGYLRILDGRGGA